MWIEKVNTEFKITTGEGSVFSVYWMNAEKSKEYNITEFTFPEVAGSFVDRRQPKGRKYNLEIFFQGDNHLEESAGFETAADDPRAWVISHPYYGEITVQPVSLSFDNKSHGVTKITGTVIETITNENPITSPAPFDTVKLQVSNTNALLGGAYSSRDQSVSDVTQQQQYTQTSYNLGRKTVPSSEIGQEYYSAFRQVQAKINLVSSDASAPLTAIQTFIETPARFGISVSSRVNLFYDQFSKVRNSLGNISQPGSKNSYLTWLGMLISGSCLSTVNPLDSDYKTRPEVISLADTISQMRSDYIEDLDSLQTANGGTKDSFIPDAFAMQALDRLVNLTISNLFTIALGARQERSIICEEDTNVILLTHRLYGLDPDDSNMLDLMDANNILLNEVDNIRKGRKIVYYV